MLGNVMLTVVTADGLFFIVMLGMVILRARKNYRYSFTKHYKTKDGLPRPICLSFHRSVSLSSEMSVHHLSVQMFVCAE